MVAALDAMREQGFAQVRGGGVELSVVFYVPRGKGHYGTGRNEGVLKATAPARPAVRPDVDKWLRQVLDALKGAVYHDTARWSRLSRRRCSRSRGPGGDGARGAGVA